MANDNVIDLVSNFLEQVANYNKKCSPHLQPTKSVEQNFTIEENALNRDELRDMLILPQLFELFSALHSNEVKSYLNLNQEERNALDKVNEFLTKNFPKEDMAKNKLLDTIYEKANQYKQPDMPKYTIAIAPPGLRRR